MTPSRPQPLWHCIPTPECIERLGSRSEGLTTAETARRLADGGPNKLELAEGRSNWQILWDQFSNAAT